MRPKNQGEEKLTRRDEVLENQQSLVRALRSSLPYLEEFHHQVFVVCVNGELLQRDAAPKIMEELALLHRVGIQLVLVHDSQLLNQSSLDTSSFPVAVSRHDLTAIKQQIAAINWEFLTKLCLYGHGIMPLSGHFVTARADERFSTLETDSANGVVQEVDLVAIRETLQLRHTPLLAPWGTGQRGRLWLLEARELASEIAVRLQARKLIFLEDTPSPLMEKDRNTSILRQWLRQQTSISEINRLRLECMATACERGVTRCHWLDATKEGALLTETLTSGGIGLMVTNTAYRQVRAAKPSDIPQVWGLLSRPMRDASIVQRSTSYLEQHIERYRLFCQDEDVLGCCELISYPEQQTVEIAALSVALAYRNQGIGRELVNVVLGEIKRQGAQRAIALSTREDNVFMNCGFKECSLEDLPPDKRFNYDSPQSKIYLYSLVEPGKDLSTD
ncbi:MAG: amino-acid N-acetyltransferase [bacterium]